MQDVTLILLITEGSSNFTHKVKKEWLYQGDTPLWLKVIKEFEESFKFKEIVVVTSKEDISYMQRFANYRFVERGSNRRDSLKNSLKYATEWVMVSDIERCCIDKNLIKKMISNVEKASCIVPTVKITDTAYCGFEPINSNREKLRVAQTPQLSKTEVLKEALKVDDATFTDESSAIWRFNKDILFIDSSNSLYKFKLDSVSDLKFLDCLTPPSNDTFVGFGLDIHQFMDDSSKKMFLGGVEIDVDFSLKAHSDGDVVIHSLIDALLGAIGGGDIGELFPDSSEKYKNIDSKKLLKESVEILYSRGFVINNVDIVINAQKPRMGKYKDKIAETLSSIIEVPKHKINIKATTSESMGFVGREEGIMVKTAVSIKYYDWRELL